MIDIIRQFALKHNILFGVCGVTMRRELETALLKVKAPFVSCSDELRLNPGLTVSGAKSIIVIGVPYPKRDTSESRPNTVKFSMNAVSTDYHITVKETLEKLDKALKALFSFSSASFTDTGPLVERELAVMSGIGFYGKNGSVISKEYGSLFNIGYIITDAEITATGSNIGLDICGECGECIKACIGGAIGADGFTYKKCLSYLTQCRDFPKDVNESSLCGYIYGCDICQLVCPYNAHLPLAGNSDCYINVDELKSMSNKAFKNKFRDTAVFWRGNRIIKRNAGIKTNN